MLPLPPKLLLLIFCMAPLLFLVTISSWRDAAIPPLSFSSQVLAVHHWAVSFLAISCIDCIAAESFYFIQICDGGADSGRVMDGGSIRTPHWGCHS